MTTLSLIFDELVASDAVTFTEAGDGPKRTVRGPAFPLNQASGPSSLDGRRYRFTALPENVDELVDVVDEHDAGAVVGRLSAPWELDDAQVAQASVRLFDTTRGRDMAVEVAEAVKTGYSVGALVTEFTEADDGVRDVTAWRAVHLGIVRRPAFTESRGLTLAASAQKEGTPMTAATDTAPPVVELPTVAELAAQVAVELDRQTAAQTHPLAQFPTAGQFYQAFAEADDAGKRELSVAFALVDQLLAENPGLTPPNWRTRIIANLDARRPAIGLFGTEGIGDTGMTINWPVFTGDLDAIVAQQLAESDELNSVKVSIGDDSASILTGGAASNITYQTLARTSPAYIGAYQTIMDAAWARFTEAKCEAAVDAVATASERVDLASATAKKDYAAQLFDLSGQVEDATGSPAEFVLVASDVWSQLGGLYIDTPARYGTQNTAGQADARNQTLEVAGIEHRRAPFLTAGKTVISNAAAAKFAETGAMLATAEDVAKLGRQVATWGMYVPLLAYFPAGILATTPFVA